MGPPLILLLLALAGNSLADYSLVMHSFTLSGSPQLMRQHTCNGEKHTVEVNKKAVNVECYNGTGNIVFVTQGAPIDMEKAKDKITITLSTNGSEPISFELTPDKDVGSEETVVGNVVKVPPTGTTELKTEATRAASTEVSSTTATSPLPATTNQNYQDPNNNAADIQVNPVHLAAAGEETIPVNSEEEVVVHHEGDHVAPGTDHESMTAEEHERERKRREDALTSNDIVEVVDTNNLIDAGDVPPSLTAYFIIIEKESGGNPSAVAAACIEGFILICLLGCCIWTFCVRRRNANSLPQGPIYNAYYDNREAHIPGENPRLGDTYAYSLSNPGHTNIALEPIRNGVNQPRTTVDQPHLVPVTLS